MHKAIKYLEGYTRQYLYKAKLARELQGMSGHPSERGYKDIVSNKLFPNFLSLQNTSRMQNPSLDQTYHLCE